MTAKERNQFDRFERAYAAMAADVSALAHNQKQIALAFKEGLPDVLREMAKSFCESVGEVTVTMRSMNENMRHLVALYNGQNAEPVHDHYPEPDAPLRLSQPELEEVSP